MRRGVLATLVGVAIVFVMSTAACSDDEPPTSHASSGAPVSSGSELSLARSLARSLVDGIQQGANGQVATTQADCLVDAIANGIRVKTLSDIASAAPEPKSLPRDVRETFGLAFDRCLPGDQARQLRSDFGL
jgi:hypothetical protein